MALRFLLIAAGMAAMSTIQASTALAGDPSPQAEKKTTAAARVVEKIRPALVDIRETREKDKEAPKSKPPAPVIGILIDAKGTVVTNHSLIKGWKKAEVVLSDGRRLPSKTIQVDPDLDLAVIKVEDRKPFPHAEAGDSDKVKAGDLVLAWSYPWTVPVDEPLMVTAGMIAGNARAKKNNESVFVVDTTTGPGCTPGPLIGREGKFLGLVIDRDLIPRGTNGAIPANQIMERLAAWAKKGR